MNFENHINPTPDKDERIIWQHKGVQAKVYGPTAFARTRSWIWKLFLLLINIYWAWNLFKIAKEVQNDNIDLQEIGLILFVIGVFYLIVFIVIKRARKNQASNPIGSIPLWLSEGRLALAATGKPDRLLIETDDILSLSTDYSAGSPAIALETSQRKYSLVSSDRDSLLGYLYTIRPDLKPSL